MISFVTVVFNDLQGLQDTIRSVKHAHLMGIPLQHIIIDGNSTDGTKEFIKSLKVPYQLVCVSEEDYGIYDAMNKGLDRCCYDYVNFLNAGDVLCFDKFDWHKFKSDLQDSGADIIACGYIFKDIKSKTKYVSPRRITCIYPGMPSSHQAMFFRYKAIKGARFNINFRVCGDFDFVMKMIYNGATISLFDGPVVVFRSGGLSFQKPMVLFRESMGVSANYCTTKLIVPLKALQLILSLGMLHIRRWI